jgi:hypothetical protein
MKDAGEVMQAIAPLLRASMLGRKARVRLKAAR